MSFGLKYSEDQMKARAALASKAETAPIVMLQQFDPEQHASMLNNVSVLGEVDPSMITVVDLADGSQLRVAPVFPISHSSVPFAIRHILESEGLARRPMPRGLQAVQGRPKSREQLLAGGNAIEMKIAAGVAILDEIEDAPGTSLGGSGEYGELYEINGAWVQSDIVEAQVNSTFATNGVNVINGALFIAPMVRNGVVTPSYTNARRVLEFAAVAFLAFPFLSLLFLSAPRQERRAETVGGLDDMSPARSESYFQPIMRQAELEESQEPEWHEVSLKRAVEWFKSRR